MINTVCTIQNNGDPLQDDLDSRIMKYLVAVYNRSADPRSPFMMALNRIGLLLCVLLVLVNAQQSAIEVSVDLGEGLVYFLVIFFFGLTFCTPIVRWLYVNYLSLWVEKAGKEVNKASKRFTERMSDASRRVTQSIRVEK